MARKDLTDSDYDSFLAGKAEKSKSARQELVQRKAERRKAHDSEGVGYHFGLGDGPPVKIKSREHLRSELDKRGLMLEVDVKRDLK